MSYNKPRELVDVRRAARMSAVPKSCELGWYVAPREGNRRVDKGHPGAVYISCGRCVRCAITKKEQLVGRAIAEQNTSARTAFVTLTYAKREEWAGRGKNGWPIKPPKPLIPGDKYALSKAAQYVESEYLPDGTPTGALKIVPGDWQVFRKTTYKKYGHFEYFGASERGELGRCHIHAQLYFEHETELVAAENYREAVRAEMAARGERVPGEIPLPAWWKDKVFAPAWVDLPRVVDREYRRAVRSGAMIPADMHRPERFMCCGVEVARQLQTKAKFAGMGPQYRFIAWIPEWPWGYVNVGEANAQTAGYIAAYMVSPDKAEKLRGPNSTVRTVETKVYRSQRLGYAYIRSHGEDAAKQGLQLSGRYRLPGQVYNSGYREGKAKLFTMTPGMKRVACEAYIRQVIRMLGRGEVRKWASKAEIETGDLVAEMLEKDARRDPRRSLEVFFAAFEDKRFGSDQIPRFDIGLPVAAVSTPDGGIVVKTARGEFVAFWPDVADRMGNLRIPLKDEAEARDVLARGIATALDFDADHRFSRPREREVEIRQVDLAKVLEREQELGPLPTTWLEEATQRDRAAALGLHRKRGDPVPTILRAVIRKREISMIRARVVALLMARWAPVSIGPDGWPVGNKFGLPMRVDGSVFTKEDAEQHPLFGQYWREEMPDVPY